MYQYRPQNEDELELREGDRVDVMQQCDDGWFVGMWAWWVHWRAASRGVSQGPLRGIGLVQIHGLIQNTCLLAWLLERPGLMLPQSQHFCCCLHS